MSEARVAFLVDARHAPGLTADRLEDALHVVPATGATPFSRYAADLLALPITETGQPRSAHCRHDLVRSCCDR